MSEQETGRWLVWGVSTPADVQASALAGLGSALASAISGLTPVSLDDTPAADPAASDCGEGDLFDDPGEDARLIALVHEQDPDWAPPGRGHPDPSGTISWMEVVRNATEREIQAKVAARGTAAHGFVRLT